MALGAGSRGRRVTGSLIRDPNALSLFPHRATLDVSRIPVSPGLGPVLSRTAMAARPHLPMGAHASANEVMSTELLSASEMRQYFPDAEIVWDESPECRYP